METISRCIKTLSKVLNIISRTSIFLIMVIVILNVFLRTAFNKPITGIYDVLLILSIIMISMALSFCHFTDGHVNVTFFIDKFPERIRKLVVTINHIISIVMFGGICWYLLVHYASKVRISGQNTLTLGIPFYPFYYVLALGLFFLVLVDIVKAIDEFRKEV
jgi:TRAP-type C4-dicarboxylate transport system permease small subunit